MMKSKLYFFAMFILFASCTKDDSKPAITVDSFNPDKGLSGTIVTIIGTNFSEAISQNSVTFNGVNATINSSTANQLVVVVPAGATTGKIKVSVNGSVGESASNFIVLNTPTITSFSPQSGEEGSLVTIIGNSFSSVPTENIVKFGDVSTTVTSASTTSLTVTVPTTAISGIISVTTNGLTANSVSQFTVTPVISNVTPISASIGSTITITGSGLKGSLIKFNNRDAIKVSETANELKIIAPYQTTTERTVSITLTNSNITLTYPTLFVYVNSWIRKKDFPGLDRQGVIGFAIGSKAYFGLGISNFTPATPQQILKDFWEYDPSTDNWYKKNDFSGEARYRAFSFSLDGKGYVGSGNKKDMAGAVIYLSDVWGYDPVSDSWVLRADFGGLGRGNAGSFVINNKGYIGGGTRGSGLGMKDFWEYDPSANTWTKKLDFGGIGKNDSPPAFSIGTKGYLGGEGSNSKEFWAFDITTNQWIKKNDTPVGSLFAEYFGFTINNVGYFGGDRFYYRYNEQADTWIQLDFPNSSSYGSKGVVINGKVYVLRGIELWEFTPPN
jgi:N-acetylneuraminic acid mutarotase